MAESLESKFKFEVKQDDRRTERKSTKLFGPGDSNVFRKALQDATKGNVSGQSVAEVVDQLHAIYISSVPEGLLDKDLLMQHFSQFGKVKRVYISNVRKSAIVHFENHEVAKLAKTSGLELQGHKLDIYWSKSAKVCPPGSKKSPPTSPRVASTVHKQHGETSSKVVEKVSASSKYTLSDEVKEELRSMSGGEITKYEERPHSHTSQSTMLAHHKQKALALSRIATRNKGLLVRRGSLGTSASASASTSTSAPQPAKAKVKVLPKPRTKSGDHASYAETLLALTKKQALSSEDKYKTLETRDKILRKLQSKGLMKRSHLTGTCPDMCPEKERYQREITNQVTIYERLPSTEEVKMDHQRAVKQYSRSSADQDDTLCHELRPAAVLERSMDYLLGHVMEIFGRDANLQDWFHFLWDRTRSIRKDITQQELCDARCVALMEQCARFHIHCAEQLVEEDPAVFDQKINTENLTKCLQTLKYMYDDMALKLQHCPCEAEFRAYTVLLNLNDGSFIWELKRVRPDILHSSEVQFVLRVYAAIHSQNYIKFFKLVRQTTYLNACLLQRYFPQVRTEVLLSLCKTSCPSRVRILFPVGKLMKLMAFESLAETYEFLDSCGLAEYDSEDKKCVILYRGAVSVPKLPPQMYRAPRLIESKMTGTLAQVVYGGPRSASTSEIVAVHSSFDENGYLKLEALGISGVGDSGLFRVPAGESVPKCKKSSQTSPGGTKTSKPVDDADVKQGAKKSANPDVLTQSQTPAPVRPALGVVKPINYSFTAAMGSLVQNAAPSKPGFSFTLAKPKEETASHLAATMEVDSMDLAGKRIPSGEISGRRAPIPWAKMPESQPLTMGEASQEQSEETSSDRQVSTRTTSVPTTPPGTPLQEKRSQVQSSKLPLSFSFDRSKSAVGVSQAPFLWKSKSVQEDEGKHVEKTVSMETTGTNVVFSSSPFFKREQSAGPERSEEKSDECAEAMRKEREAKEQKKRILADEQKKRQEEERERVAAQNKMQLSQNAQQVFVTLLSELTREVCCTTLKEARCVAQANQLLEEVVDCVVTENIKALMDGAIHDRRVLLLGRKVQQRKMRVACHKWQVFAARRKKHREAAKNFPPLTFLLSSPEDLYVPRPEQVALLQLPDHVLKEVSFSKLDICSLVGHRLMLRMYSLDWNSPDLFWKLAISLPDSKESIYKQEADLWAHQMFTGTHTAKPNSKVASVTSSDVVCSDVQLVSCITCVTGCVSKEPACGMSGLIFWVPSSMDDWTRARVRLRRTVVRGERLPRVSVAVVLVRNMACLTARDVAEKLGLEGLVSKGYVSEYVVKMPSHNSSHDIRATVVAAMQWLADRAPDPRPLIVEPLQHMLDQMVMKAFLQITSTAVNTMLASPTLQSPNNMIYLYNKVLCALQDWLTDPELAEYSKGAQEFSTLVPQYDHIRPCPQDCGSPEYYATITQVLKKAELSPIQPWPPTSLPEMVCVLECYCRNSGLLDHWPLYSYLECAVEEYFEQGGSPDNSHDWLEFLRSVNWTKVVEIIVCKKLESLQMLSSSKEYMPVAISKANLSSFLNTFWWFTAEEMDKVVETPFTSSSHEPRLELTPDQKRRSAPDGDMSDNSAKKRRFREMTKGIDASLAALKSLNEEIVKILEHETTLVRE